MPTLIRSSRFSVCKLLFLNTTICRILYPLECQELPPPILTFRTTADRGLQWHTNSTCEHTEGVYCIWEVVWNSFLNHRSFEDIVIIAPVLCGVGMNLALREGVSVDLDVGLLTCWSLSSHCTAETLCNSPASSPFSSDMEAAAAAAVAAVAATLAAVVTVPVVAEGVWLSDVTQEFILIYLTARRRFGWDCMHTYLCSARQSSRVTRHVFICY